MPRAVSPLNSPCGVCQAIRALRRSIAEIRPQGGLINGYPYFKSNQVNSAHQSFFGVWSQLIMASWSGLEVIVDPYALKKSGQVEITFNELVDQLVRQPLSFNVSTDTAAA